ncbi:GNAT family N-acetyltransferase [Jejudonia soesokkakensis]|uniref:GNAT family N-acetyltransferase n=1 Tax=Jejudonia soesokkakensis TaxID=1323432 RepID=A0ABW2MV62_9FLAO
MTYFPFSETIILENERVLLRPLTEADFKHLKTFSLTEPELWTYSLLPANGLENLKSYIEIALQKKAVNDSYPFIIFDKKNEQYTGSTRFYDIQQHHETTQLGYTWFGKKFQRTGLNRHCKYLMLQYAFDTLHFQRIEFRADATNAKSITAMKAIGCKEEGILRSNCVSPSGRRDSIVLSILKAEWEASVKNNLQQLLMP